VGRFLEGFKAHKRIMELKLSTSPSAATLQAIQDFDPKSLYAPAAPAVGKPFLPAYSTEQRDGDGDRGLGGEGEQEDGSAAPMPSLPRPQVVNFVVPPDAAPAPAAVGEHDWFAAILRNDMPMLRRLLQRDPGLVHKQDEEGRAALLVAATAGRLDMAELLLRAGADLGAETSTGYSAMHLAAANGHPHCLQLLLSHGAPIAGETPDRLTPLHCAALEGRTDCVRFLVERRAPLLGRSEHGLTPLALARREGHQSCVALLEAAMDELEGSEAGSPPRRQPQPPQPAAGAETRPLSLRRLQPVNDEEYHSDGSDSFWVKRKKN
jgi:hypothetical protein